MRTRIGIITLTAVAICTSAWAQEPAWRAKPKEDKARDTSIQLSSTPVAPTAEMWFYEQERRRAEDPKTLVRQRAQYDAAQRQARIASMRWFGMSNSRPLTGVDPLHGTYGPRWVSNGYQQNEWVGIGGATTVLNLESNSTRR